MSHLDYLTQAGKWDIALISRSSGFGIDAVNCPVTVQTTAFFVNSRVQLPPPTRGQMLRIVAARGGVFDANSTSKLRVDCATMLVVGTPNAVVLKSVPFEAGGIIVGASGISVYAEDLEEIFGTDFEEQGSASAVFPGTGLYINVNADVTNLDGVAAHAINSQVMAVWELYQLVKHSSARPGTG